VFIVFTCLSKVMGAPVGVLGGRAGGVAGSTPSSRRAGGEFGRERQRAVFGRNSSEPHGRSAGERQRTEAKNGQARKAAWVVI